MEWCTKMSTFSGLCFLLLFLYQLDRSDLMNLGKFKGVESIPKQKQEWLDKLQKILEELSQTLEEIFKVLQETEKLSNKAHQQDVKKLNWKPFLGIAGNLGFEGFRGKHLGNHGEFLLPPATTKEAYEALRSLGEFWKERKVVRPEMLTTLITWLTEDFDKKFTLEKGYSPAKFIKDLMNSDNSLEGRLSLDRLLEYFGRQMAHSLSQKFQRLIHETLRALILFDFALVKPDASEMTGAQKEAQLATILKNLVTPKGIKMAGDLKDERNVLRRRRRDASQVEKEVKPEAKQMTTEDRKQDMLKGMHMVENSIGKNRELANLGQMRLENAMRETEARMSSQADALRATVQKKMSESEREREQREMDQDMMMMEKAMEEDRKKFEKSTKEKHDLDLDKEEDLKILKKVMEEDMEEHHMKKQWEKILKERNERLRKEKEKEKETLHKKKEKRDRDKEREKARKAAHQFHGAQVKRATVVTEALPQEKKMKLKTGMGKVLAKKIK